MMASEGRKRSPLFKFSITNPKPQTHFRQPPRKADGTFDRNAPRSQWVEVPLPQVTIRHRSTTPPEDRDPIVREVKLHRIRRDHYGDGFLTHPTRRGHPRPRRYLLRDTPSRLESDCRLIQQRKIEVKRKHDEDTALGKAWAEEKYGPLRRKSAETEEGRGGERDSLVPGDAEDCPSRDAQEALTQALHREVTKRPSKADKGSAPADSKPVLTIEKPPLAMQRREQARRLPNNAASPVGVQKPKPTAQARSKR